MSCELGHAKPEPAAYHWCVRAFKLPPDQIIFIDDRPANTHSAAAVGLATHTFTGLPTLRSHLATLLPTTTPPP